MGLYPKKLRNIEDLEQERRALLREKEQLEKDDLFSVEGLLGDGKKEGGAQWPDGLSGMLQGSNPLADLVSGLLKKGFEKKDTPSRTTATREGKNDKNIFATLAKEFIGGYLKWKAIELSFKGIRHLIKSRKEKE